MKKVKRLIQKLLLSKWTSRILYTMLGVFAGLFFAYLYIEHVHDNSLLDLLKALSPVAILLSVMLASRQFVYNTEWNKKDAANRALYESQKTISGYMNLLGKYYDIRERMRNKKRISIVDIHNLMGVFVHDKTDMSGKQFYKFIFHGSNINDNDIKNIHTKNDIGYTVSFDRNKPGREIERTLLALLNEFEYICLSTRKEIFDSETVIELIGPSIASAFIVFQDYIMHLRIDSRHGNGRFMTYKEIENMYEVIRAYKNNLFNFPELKILDYDTEDATKRYKVPFRLS